MGLVECVIVCVEGVWGNGVRVASLRARRRGDACGVGGVENVFDECWCGNGDCGFECGVIGGWCVEVGVGGGEIRGGGTKGGGVGGRDECVARGVVSVEGDICGDVWLFGGVGDVVCVNGE